MVYGYIRVSTGKQTLENQRLERRRYCKFHRLRNIVFVQETVSGTKRPEKRKLGNLIEKAQDGDSLLSLLEEIKGKFLLSSYRNKSLNESIASHGWHTAEIRMHCPMTSRAAQVHSKVEVLTANFPFNLNLDGTHKKLVTGAE